jgi:membrane protease YdiL (CAAX protease family)
VIGRALSAVRNLSLRNLTVGNWRQIDEDWIEPVPTDKQSYDWRPLIVFVTVCISLTLQEYYGDRGVFAQHFPELFRSEHGELWSFAWWSGWRVFGYIVLPIIAIWVMPGERVRDYFISFKGVLKHLWIYFGLFALVLPFVLMAAQSDSFLRTYPFYKLANRSSFDFWMWEALYVVQFFSLEFFFRGFMLKATAPRLGSAAIYVMLIPYCMIHFGKPMSETFGAIIAGMVLGTLALRTRSIWGGVLIHVGVALTMDLLALSNCPPAESGLRCPRH